jgi:hypothetical protein
MTPRTCWVIPAEGSEFEKRPKPPVLVGIDGFFYDETTGQNGKGVKGEEGGLFWVLCG